MTSRCCWLIQPATATTRNCSACGNGHIPAERSRGESHVTRFSSKQRPDGHSFRISLLDGGSSFWTVRGAGGR